PALPIKLEAFRMRLQPDVTNLRPLGRIDHRQSAAAVTNKDSVGVDIDPNVIGVPAQIHLANRRILSTLKQPNGSTADAGNIKRVGRSGVANALRLLQSRNGSNGLLRL